VFTVTQPVETFTVPIQPGKPFQFHQKPTISPHSQPPEHSSQFHIQFRKTSAEG